MRRITLLTFVAPLLFIACPAGAADDARQARDCAGGFLAALLDGDAGRAGAFACSDDAGTSRIVEAMAINLGTQAKLTAAVRRRFAATGEPAGGRSAAARVIEGCEVEFDGDTAELGRPAGETLPLRRVNGGWKVDAAELAARRKIGNPAAALALARARAAGVDALVREVEAGGYATAGEVHQALERRLTAAAPTGVENVHASVE